MKNFYRLIQGDCLKVLPTLEDESVDLVVTDPPFYLPARHYASRDDKWKPAFSDLQLLGALFRQIFKEYKRILKKEGHLFCFCDCVSYPILYQEVYGLWDNIRALIWYKGKNHYSLGHNQPFRYSYEMILHARNSNCFFIKENRQDVLTARVVPNKDRFHPAQKPEKIIKELICASTKENAVILDSFLGYGTTMKVAQELGRNCIGIEINSNDCENTKKRCFGRQFLDRQVEYKFEVFNEDLQKIRFLTMKRRNKTP